MFAFLYSLTAFASPVWEAILYQDTTILPSEKQHWQALANITPLSEQLYANISTSPVSEQEAQADALFIAAADPVKIREIYERSSSTEPQLQAKLIHALAKNGDCSIMPILDSALRLSHPLRLPEQTEAALYGLGILADHQQCDFSKEIDWILPMLQSFSTPRRKAAAFALSVIQPQWENPEEIWKATIREPHPLIRSWLVRASTHSNPSEEMALHWFSDSDQKVRQQAIDAQPQSALLPELLKDEELWVQLHAITALGANGANLSRIIEAGANIDAEEQSMVSQNRRFAQSLVAIEASQQVHTSSLLSTERPTEIRRAAASKVKEERQLKKLLADKEASVRSAAARNLIKTNPENLDLLLSLLESDFPDVVSTTLYNIASEQEGALDESIWNLLPTAQDNNIARILHTLIALESTKEKEEAEILFSPLWEKKRLDILLPLHRLARSLRIDAPSFEWPETQNLKTSFRIETEYGELQADLFTEEAPIICWQWIEQLEQQIHKQPLIRGDAQYLTIELKQPLYDIGERNTRPVERGSLLFDPQEEEPAIWIAREDHPLDRGKYVVFGKIVDGEHILRQLRPQERIKKMMLLP